MCGRGDAADRRREASNGGDLRASRLLCGAGKLSMAGSYKVAFLKALDEAYPGWSGEVAPTASSPSRRTDALQASAVDVMPGEPGLPAGTARGYEPRQKPPTPSDQRSSKPEDRQERQRAELVALGCDHAQGYLFSRPTRPDLLNRMLGRRWALTSQAGAPCFPLT